MLILLAAILVSQSKVRFVIYSGIGFALAMVVLLLMLPVVQQQFMEAAAEFTPEAAGAIFTTITRSLRQAALVVLSLGLVIAGGTYFLFRLVSRKK